MAWSDLTTSGLLYEGSEFAEWKAKVNAVLRVKDLQQTIVSPTRRGIRFEKLLNSAEVAVIRSYVSQGLLDRVCAKHMENSRALFKSLAGLASPFRLLDLPAELRQMIYKLALPKTLVFELGARGRVPALVQKSSPKFAPGRIPALLHASLQLRNETLPVYHAATFHLYLPNSRCRGVRRGDGPARLRNKIRRLVEISGGVVGPFLECGPAHPKKHYQSWSVHMLKARPLVGPAVGSTLATNEVFNNI